MNKQHIQELIDLMGTVKPENFSIDQWVYGCGTPSCVAGWATTLPSWQERGHLLNGNRPLFDGAIDEAGFAKWAEISDGDASVICATGGDDEEFYAAEYDHELGVYPKVSPAMVVEALTRFLETGSTEGAET
jgi:hypothetical protein